MAPTEPFAWLLWQFGYSICHQMGDRSLFVDGHQYPIDARMSGIFLGFLITSLYLLLMDRWRRPKLPDRIVMVFAVGGALAMMLDVVTSYSGMRPTTNLIRLATGFAMGAAVGLLFPAVWRLVMAGGKPFVGRGVPVSTWRDLPVVYGLIFVTGAAVYTTRTGLGFYYLIAASMIVAYILLFHLAIRLLVKSILVPRLGWLATNRKQIAVAVFLQGATTFALWAAHLAADRAMGMA